ncbi:MAG: 7-cyano-7-deazaguanine synthase [Phycisphaerae bacterium]|nr:7-cyano-7-deazaguanine synthase [Tepidisphaeraceae bacterium]
MPRDLAIVLNSGSINSAVTTALAAQRYRLVLLHAETGAAAAGARRRAAYDQQVAHFKPYREHSLAMPFLAAVSEPQTATANVATDPRAAETHLGPQMLDQLPLVAAAVRYGAHYGASAVYYGFRVGGSGDELAAATEFVQVWNEMIQMPCGVKDLEVMTPLLELEPWQVVDVGFNVAAPFEKTWSCWEETPEPCWACPGCRAREKAFQQAGKVDPLRMAKRP